MPAFDPQQYLAIAQQLQQGLQPTSSAADIVNSLAPPQRQAVQLPPPPSMEAAQPNMAQNMASSFAGALRGLPRDPKPLLAAAPAGISSAHAQQYAELINGINNTMLAQRHARTSEEQAASQQETQKQELEMRRQQMEMERYNSTLQAEGLKRELGAPLPEEMAQYQAQLNASFSDLEAQRSLQNSLVTGGLGAATDEMGLRGDLLQAQIGATNRSYTGTAWGGAGRGAGAKFYDASWGRSFTSLLENAGIKDDGGMAAALTTPEGVRKLNSTVAPFLQDMATTMAITQGIPLQSAYYMSANMLGIPREAATEFIRLNNMPALEGGQSMSGAAGGPQSGGGGGLRHIPIEF